MPGIAHRRGRWTATVYDPRAKSRQRYLGTFDSEGAARSALEAEKAVLRKINKPKGLTVAEWCDRWLIEHPRPAAATNKNYKWATKTIKADIGHYRLASVDRALAVYCVGEWKEGITRCAFALFRDAYADGILLQNPFKELRRKRNIGRKDLDAPTEQEILDFADAAVGALADYGPEFRAIVLWLGFVGCRPGELCCIRREDVDHTRGEVAIRFALDSEGGEKFPKNNRQRVVMVPPVALDALANVPVRTNSIGTQSPYLFHTVTGRRLNKGSLHYYFRQAKAAWGKRPALQPYHLRHGCATLLLERGNAPHVVAYQLGHTDGGVLVQTLYGHPSDEGMRSLLHGSFDGPTPERLVVGRTAKRSLRAV